MWALITYSDKERSWYTFKPALLEYRLGLYRSKPIHRIDINTSEGENVDKPEDTTKGKQPTSKSLTPIFKQYAMSTTQTQLATATASGSGLAIQAIPTGGGGGGGGGGGSGGGGGGGVPTGPPGSNGGGGGALAGPPPLTGKLRGNPPKEFHRDREESKAFLLNFLLYRGMNPHVEQLAVPYQRSMTFLSYIRGPLVNNWVKEQA